MITSTTNKQVKYVSSLIKKPKARREEDLFVAEGLRICQEIPEERIHTLYVSESFLKQKEGRILSERVRRVEVVADEVFKALSDTQTPQGVLALVRQYHYTLEQAAGTKDGKPALLMILEHLQDPGNLGTMFRTGEGAGVTGVIMHKTTVDLFHPKTVRSTMGSLYRVPFYVAEDWEKDLHRISEAGISLYAAHLQGKQMYDMFDYRSDCGFLIGNEGNGLTDATAAMADAYLRIPMEGSVESLNAAMAAGILMYEVNRQRRQK